VESLADFRTGISMAHWKAGHSISSSVYRPCLLRNR
jgi:hypothetical protein